MRQLEAALTAAGDRSRTRILKMLETRELCVCQIQAVLGLAPSTVSKHLSILKSADLVEDRREGRWTHYTLASGGDNPHASGVLSLLRGALDRDPKILEDRRRLREVLRMSLADVCALMPIQSVSSPAATSGRRASPRKRAHV